MALDGNGNQAYGLYARQFLKRIVGENIWSHNSYRALLSTYCTVSDEAFGLLTIENNYDRWTNMQESGDMKDVAGNAPPPKYTNPGKGKNVKAGARRFQGWSIEGYKRFDELHKAVKASRQDELRVLFEEGLKDYFAEELAKKVAKRKRATKHGEEEEEEVIPAHDFDDVDMGGNDSDNSDSGSRPPDAIREGSDDDEEEEGSDEQPPDLSDDPGDEESSSDGNSEPRKPAAKKKAGRRNTRK